MINYEKEVCDYLRIPGIPLKEWNGKDSFTNGVGVVTTHSGRETYVVVSFDKERDIDGKPRVIKVFDMEPFANITKVFVVPSYMDVIDDDDMDLDDESKENARKIAHEAIVEENTDGAGEIVMPDNEYLFDNIHSDEEARAFISAWNKANKIKGGIPTKHDSIVMRLSVIWAESQKEHK